MKPDFLQQTVQEVVAEYPHCAAFFALFAPTEPRTAPSAESRTEPGTEAEPFTEPFTEKTLPEWLATLDDETLFDRGFERDQVLPHLQKLCGQVAKERVQRNAAPHYLQVIPGFDKDGQPETVGITLVRGDVVCIVGPTGAGKSRLLADIECLAQGDTPTRRQILIDGAVPTAELRDAWQGQLVVQISQNMNFVVDMAVADFVAMHVACRRGHEDAALVERILQGARELCGEPFDDTVALTQLSGGQSRALMIADAAWASTAPIVLIDEIENAGIDRRKALELLSGHEKIVLISTHDPLLALLGNRRLVIRRGAMAQVVQSNAWEKRLWRRLDRWDHLLGDLRMRIRAGEPLNDAPENQ